jgi:hypothetical protein
MKVRIFAFAVASAATIASAHAQQTADDHLGTVHFAISCSAVQNKFDRAVAMLQCLAIWGVTNECRPLLAVAELRLAGWRSKARAWIIGSASG